MSKRTETRDGALSDGVSLVAASGSVNAKQTNGDQRKLPKRAHLFSRENARDISNSFILFFVKCRV